MPPLYTWEDKKTGLRVEVLREFSEYKNPPVDEELEEGERGRDREWSRLIGSGIHVSKPLGWGGKGSW